MADDVMLHASISFPPSLPRCLEVEEGEREALEYTQQLLLGFLLSLCTHLSSQGVDNARGKGPTQ